MIDNISLNNQVLTEDLFELFKIQLAKDFETCGLDSGFVSSLVPDFASIKETIIRITLPLFESSSGTLPNLLYRIDISEQQLKIYSSKHPDLQFPEVVVELIIKRILQKIILKKKFSS